MAAKAPVAREVLELAEIHRDGWSPASWVAYLRRRASECLIAERKQVLEAALELAEQALAAEAPHG